MRFIFIIFSFFLFYFCRAQVSDRLSIAERINNSTIRIECQGDTLINGARVAFGSTGTGFFFEFNIDSFKVPVIVTNYHVIQNTKRGILHFTDTGKDSLPLYGQIITKTIDNFGGMWIKHPTEDLAILPVNPIIQDIIRREKRDPFFIYFDESLIPTKELVKEIDAIEDILMVGYPHGFWDEKNNLPIVRKGLTATPFYLDYNKEPHFLIDIPIYPGSSGSPIILYNQGSYGSRQGGLIVGSRIALLGINVQSVNYNALGELVPQSGLPKIPTYTNLPFNIAVVIKSSELIAFKPILQMLVHSRN